MTSERSVTRGKPTYDVSHAKTSFTDLPDGSQMFRLCFRRARVWRRRLHDHDRRRHAEGVGETRRGVVRGGANTHQFNRQVAIPNNVDPDSLTSYLSPGRRVDARGAGDWPAVGPDGLQAEVVGRFLRLTPAGVRLRCSVEVSRRPRL